TGLKTHSQGGDLMSVVQSNPTKLVIFIGSLLILAVPMLGQTFYGSIVGTVSDPSGGAIQGATVTLTNNGTGERRVVTSAADGGYRFVNLVPGNYRLEIEQSGFRRYTRD